MHGKKMFSLKKQISRFLLWGLFAVVMVIVVILAFLIQEYQNDSNRKRIDDLSAYAQSLDDSIVQLNDVTGSIYSTNSAFQGLDQYRSSAEKCEYMDTLRNLFKIQVKSNGNLDGMFVYYDNLESFLYYLDDMISFNEKEALRKNGRAVAQSITRNYSQSILAAEQNVYLSIYLKRYTAVIGGLVRLNRGLPGELEKTAAYGIIHEGEFYKTAGQPLELTPAQCEKLTPGRNRIGNTVVYLRELETAELSVVEIIPVSLWLYVHWLHLLLAVFVVLLIFCAIRIYRLVTEQMTDPLEDMTEALQKLQAGEWEVEFSEKNRIEEIDNVQKTVKVLLREIEQYKIRTYEEQLEKQKTQLQYLQLQLAPHFYTNCLKNAYCMLMLGEYGNVEQFLLCLSNHLRYLLQKDLTMVTVRSECEFVRNYIELQKLMTSRGLVCEMAVEETVLGLEIPLLSLQTFVENSVKYARDMGDKTLVIRISVKYRRTEFKDYLDIKVNDNGPGYPKEVIRMLNQEAVSRDSRLGVGVTNLLSRMRIQYGEEVNWFFDNADGAVSEVFLPVRMEEANERIACR